MKENNSIALILSQLTSTQTTDFQSYNLINVPLLEFDNYPCYNQ